MFLDIKYTLQKYFLVIIIINEYYCVNLLNLVFLLHRGIYGTIDIL